MKRESEGEERVSDEIQVKQTQSRRERVWEINRWNLSSI